MGPACVGPIVFGGLLLISPLVKEAEFDSGLFYHSLSSYGGFMVRPNRLLFFFQFV